MDALPDTRFNAIVGRASAAGDWPFRPEPCRSGPVRRRRRRRGPARPRPACRLLFGGGDGLADISFDSLHMVAGVATQSDGKVIVVGTAITAGMGNRGMDMFVLRLKADGTLDTSFGTNGEAIIDLNMMDNARRVVILQPDGKILIAGITYPDGDQNNGYSLAMARLTAAGLPDSLFGTAGHVIGEGPVAWSTGGLAIQADGKIISAARPRRSSGRAIQRR